MEHIELIVAALVGIGMLVFKITRYATLQEADNKHLREKVDELTAKLAAAERNGAARHNGRDLEFGEGVGFLVSSAVRLLEYASEQNKEAVQKLEEARGLFAKWRGLDKSYTTGERDAK